MNHIELVAGRVWYSSTSSTRVTLVFCDFRWQRWRDLLLNNHVLLLSVRCWFELGWFVVCLARFLESYSLSLRLNFVEKIRAWKSDIDLGIFKVGIVFWHRLGFTVMLTLFQMLVSERTCTWLWRHFRSCGLLNISTVRCHIKTIYSILRKLERLHFTDQTMTHVFLVRITSCNQTYICFVFLNTLLAFQWFRELLIINFGNLLNDLFLRLFAHRAWVYQSFFALRLNKGCDLRLLIKCRVNRWCNLHRELLLNTVWYKWYLRLVHCT